MDYLNEAKNAEMFRDMHKHNQMIAVPKIYKEITSRRVLTMEWIEGTKLTNLEDVKKLGIDPDKMIDIGVQCSLEQLLEHGFFHADPHPGNLLALEDGRLCYLDVGMMSEVSRESRSGLIQAVVHLANKNFDKLSQDFVKLGFLSEEVNLKPIVPAFQEVFINAVEQGVSKMDFKSVTDDMSGVMYKFPFRLPPYYALIIRSLLTLEGIALSVDPNFKILGAAYPYFARRLMEDPDPQLRESLKEMLFDNKKFKWDRLEDLLSNAAKQTNLDLEKLLDEVINLLFSPKGGFLRNEIIDNTNNSEKAINRKLLRKIIFKHSDSKKWIEKLLHPLIKEKMIKECSQYRNNQTIVLVIPLLFEAKFEDICTEIWLVKCPKELQKTRLIKRDKISEKEAYELINFQLSFEEKRKFSDIILDNSDDQNKWVNTIKELL